MLFTALVLNSCEKNRTRQQSVQNWRQVKNVNERTNTILSYHALIHLNFVSSYLEQFSLASNC